MQTHMRRRTIQMRNEYHEQIDEEDTWDITRDSKMALRQNKRYIPYIFALLVCWFLYKFLLRSTGPPQYACIFMSKNIHNYSWTYPDCMPAAQSNTGNKPPVVWTEECFHKALPEDEYGRPKPPADHQANVAADGKVKVPGLRNTCPPFPVESFLKDALGEAHRTTHDGSHHTQPHAPKFVKIAPGDWLYGVFAVHDLRVTGPFSKIRIFGVSRIIPGEIYCQFSCKEHAHAVISSPAVSTAMRIDENVDDSCFWQPYMFTCEVRQECTPGYASISKAPCGHVVGALPVMVVNNTQQPPPHMFGLCLSTIHNKRDSDTAHLVEYLEASRLFGVQKIFLYGTYNVSRRYKAVIGVYQSQGLIETIPWDIPKEVSVLYRFGQLLQYAHCSYLTMNEAQFMGLVQLEDLFFPTHTSNWKSFFEQIKANERLDNKAHIDLEKRSMCLSEFLKDQESPSYTTNGRKRLQLRFVSQHAFGEVHKEYVHIIQPRGIIMPYVYKQIITMRGWLSMKVSPALAIVYHYASNDALCSEVNPNTRNDITLCKTLPRISELVINALSSLDLISTGNRHISAQDAICT